MIRNTILLASAALISLAVAAPVCADEARAAAVLNKPLSAVQETNKSWKPLMTAASNLTTPPQAVGPDFNLLTIWPGMTDWAKVKEWAAANGDMGKALHAAEKSFIFGMPYGRASVPPELVEKGVYVSIGDGANEFVTKPAYLKTLDAVGAYVAAEMYRLGEEKKFDEAFALGVAALRVWRQVADQQLLDEKVYALEGICNLCSIQRDFIYFFLKDIPASSMKRAALDGYAFIRPSDGERLKRLEMPEGDKEVANIALEGMFDSRGQADRAKFAAILSPVQALDEPLTQFGAARRWESIADVHGSLEATRLKLTSIYDDWWRRWRVRYFDSLLDNPTALTKTNRIRYAMVLLLAKDLESVFVLRKRANAELNGIVLASGLCAWNRELGTWPRSFDQAYTQFVRKRFDYDPFDPNYGRWRYDPLPTPKIVESGEFGRLELKDALLYAMGLDRQDSGGMAASFDGLQGDFIAWPPLRAVAREQGAKPAAAAGPSDG